MVYGGDIIKFTKNSTMAMWRYNGQQELSTYIHQALDCAIVIQKQCKQYLVTNKLPLKIKLVVGAGSVLKTFLGNEDFIKMLIFGQLFEETKNVRKQNRVDDIICSQTAMQYICVHEYIHEPLLDEAYYKAGERHPAPLVLYISPVEYLSIIDSFLTEFFIIVRPISETIILEDNAVQKLKKFLLESIKKSIEFNEPMRNLSETRQIVVAVMKITTREHLIWQILGIADEAMGIIQRYATKNYGTIYDINIINRNIHISLVFGLRGYKHYLECKRCLITCLNSTLELRSRFSTLDTISVGVCRGKTFCSVIGHSSRRDYVIVGSATLRARILSETFINMVTCDASVFLHSKLKYDCFESLEEQFESRNYFEGPIYEFLRDDGFEPTTIIQYTNPTLGNEKEVALFKEYLRNWLRGSEGTEENILVIKGFAKEGKTRLMYDMICECEPGVPVDIIHLTPEDEDKPFNLIRKIFSTILGLTNLTNKEERKKKLKKYLIGATSKILSSMYELFDLDDKPPEIIQLFLSISGNALEEGLTILHQQCFKFPWLIAIDNADFMDKASWTAMLPMIKSDLFFLLMTCRKNFRFPSTDVFDDHLGQIIILKGIEREYITGFACQFLKVYGIPADLEFVLHRNSNGNPGWIENLLSALLLSEIVVIKEMSFDKLPSFGLVYPPLYLLHR
ncbi:hypothetical protein HHI36_000758 [Cryptolaemus montrouzieri]|uniref:Uncharacterized protein n=1 Tax=Cryptolaemus montrouzieri TaxID=559131 RepID=A0ABD2P5U4_9CUCU